MTGERLRLFVALALPATVRAALAGWADETAPPGVRRVPERNLHVTMAFLGSCSTQTAGVVAALLTSLARPLQALATADALWLPPRRPGVLAVGLSAGSDLRALHGDLGLALADAVGFEPDRRDFRPHVTVGRVRRGTRVPADPLRPPPALAFRAEALELCRSHTNPGGACYESLARVGLTPW